MSVPRYASAATDARPLGEPLAFAFSGRTAANRLLKAATTERIASWVPGNRDKSGIPTSHLMNVYRRWGEGGYGVIVSGNIMVASDHLEAAGNMILDGALAASDDERRRKYQELAHAGKAHGALMIGQLNHPGRQTKLEFQPNPVSACAIQLNDTLGMHFGKPHSATMEEISTLVTKFAEAAEFLHRSGWDGIQLHAAHGYLLAQFLSPTTNTRTDRYGGSFENRVRIILEITAAIRERVPDSFIISIKINSVEFQQRGFTTEDAADLCRLLEKDGRADFVELSGGTYESLAFHKRDSTKAREAFFLEFAEQIVPGLSKTKTYVTGGFKTAEGMVNAIKHLDGVGIARPACQEFDFGRKILSGQIAGAAKQLLDDQNFMLTNVASGTQIGQVGFDHEPMDLTKQENVDAFMADFGAWVGRLQDDKEMAMSGYVDILSVQVQPYGTAIAY